MDATQNLQCMVPRTLPAARGACPGQKPKTTAATGGTNGRVQAMRNQLLQTRQRLHEVTASVNQMERETRGIAAAGHQQEVFRAHAEVVERVRKSLVIDACPGFMAERTCCQADQLDDESVIAIRECAELINDARCDHQLAADCPNPRNGGCRNLEHEVKVSHTACMEGPHLEPQQLREAGLGVSAPASPASALQASPAPPSRLARPALPPEPLPPSTPALPARMKATNGLLGTPVLFKPHEPHGVPALPTGSLIDFASMQVQDLRKTMPIDNVAC